MNLTTVRKSPGNEVVIELLRFPIVSILDTANIVLLFQFKLKMAVQAAQTKRKFLE